MALIVAVYFRIETTPIQAPLKPIQSGADRSISTLWRWPPLADFCRSKTSKYPVLDVCNTLNTDNWQLKSYQFKGWIPSLPPFFRGTHPKRIIL